ncbi:MAG: response regulator [Bryobacteraceae bacterium]|jgi:CheY-like chemotaxis protein
MMPLTNSAAQPAPGRKVSTRPGSVCAETNVLVVDDDRSFRQLARSLLEPSGVRIAEAETGFNGLAYLKAHAQEVDAVIMDLILPDRDGISAIREVKSAFPGVKVIAVSGADSADLYLRVSAFLGADAVLPKSRIERLSSLLGEVLR